MLAIGETVQARCIHGHLVNLEIDERVLPDPSAYQYESGWWAFVEGHEDDENAPMFFISDDFTVYGKTPKTDPNQLDHYSTVVGEVVVD